MFVTKINRVSHIYKNEVYFLSPDELAELRERIVRLETRMEEMSKRLDSVTKYLRDLFDYLQKK